MLAESWEVSSDGRQIKLNLRKSVTFHSGRELTSEDVQWNRPIFKAPPLEVFQKTLSSAGSALENLRPLDAATG